MGLDLIQVVKDAVNERVHRFRVPTQQGIAEIPIPHSKMKVCPCGCERFTLQYFGTFGKPSGVLGAEPIIFKAEILVCVKCGEELQITHPTVGDKLNHKEIAS